MKLGIVVALFAMGATLHSEANPVTLVTHGQSPYVIVIRKDASPSEKRGADEIKNYIKQISGAELPIVTDDQPAKREEIVIGIGKRTEEGALRFDEEQLGPESFYLKTLGPKLYIVGSSKRGAMYGCYEVLERLGVRWYTSKVTKLPHSSDLALPDLDEKQTPSFEYREPFFTEAFEKDWAARNKVNGSNQHLDASTGGQVKFAEPFVHTFDKLIPPALFQKHPEYFPFRDNKRQPSGQRCLTNPDVLKLVVANVNKWIDEQPDAVIFSVSQNDTGGWCECDKCKAIEKKYGGEHSGLYIWFVNQVAQQIEKKHPDKLIDTLSYQFTEAPPTGIKPHRNVRIRLCPINCCEAHPYELCSQEPNKAFVQRLKGWSKIANVLYIWHYNTDFGHYLMPFPDFMEFPADTRMYKKNGVKGIFFQGDYAPGGGGSDAELRSWVMAKLLWNQNVDTDSLVTEWMQGVYGPASKPLRQWFDLLHAQLKDPTPKDKIHHLFIYDGPRIEIFTGPVLAEGNKLFDEAEKLAETDVQKEYVKKGRLSIRYVDLIHHPDSGRKLKDFIADCKSFGITQLNEGRPIDQWEADYIKSHPATK